MMILFLIRNLGSGGAERQLVLLANSLSKKYRVSIMTFYDTDNFYLKDVSKYVQCITLNKKSRWDLFTFFSRFYKKLAKIKPDIIYAFMDSAELLALGFKAFNHNTKLVWGIRSSNMDFRNYDKLNYLLRQIECLLSPFSDLIISNSFSGRDFAIEDGFLNKNISVVHNGINTKKFFPDLLVGRALRKELDISKDEWIIGVVARHDPMKGLNFFIKAATLHLKSYPETTFVIIGKGTAKYTMELKGMIDVEIARKFIWIEPKTNIEYYYNIMDTYTSSSVYGEGFSNTVGEAMSWGVPCVVTDVGDSKLIVGSTGIVISKCSPDEMNNAWNRIRELSPAERLNLGRDSRKRIIDYYSVEKMVLKTEDLLQTCCSLKA